MYKIITSLHVSTNANTSDPVDWYDTRTNSVGPDAMVHNELSLQDLQFAMLRWFVYARGDNPN